MANLLNFKFFSKLHLIFSKPKYFWLLKECFVSKSKRTLCIIRHVCFSVVISRSYSGDSSGLYSIAGSPHTACGGNRRLRAETSQDNMDPRPVIRLTSTALFK